MGEQFFNLVWNTATIPFARWGVLVVVTGIRSLARFLLGKYYGITVTTGIEIYPERRVLNKYSDLENKLKNTETVEVYSITGLTFINIISNPERYIKKLLLPDPDCDSLKNLESTTNREDHFSPIIRNVTESAKARKIDVKWYSEFIGYSFYIVDRNKDDGWLHVEFVLPHTIDHLKRPSMRIKKNKQKEIFSHFVKAFDDMWDDAIKPSETEHLNEKPSIKYNGQWFGNKFKLESPETVLSTSIENDTYLTKFYINCPNNSLATFSFNAAIDSPAAPGMPINIELFLSSPGEPKPKVEGSKGTVDIVVIKDTVEVELKQNPGGKILVKIDLISLEIS